MWPWRKRSDKDFSEEIRANIALDEDRFIAEGLTRRDLRLFAPSGMSRERKSDSMNRAPLCGSTTCSATFGTLSAA